MFIINLRDRSPCGLGPLVLLESGVDLTLASVAKLITLSLSSLSVVPEQEQLSSKMPREEELVQALVSTPATMSLVPLSPITGSLLI